MDKQTKGIKDIIADLKTCKYKVDKVGAKWRVIDPDPNSTKEPAFMPNVLAPKNVQPMIDRLYIAGYDISQAEAIRQADHDERVAADKEVERKLLARAKNEAAARTAAEAAMAQFEEELVAEFNRQQEATKLAKGAVLVGDGVRFDQVQLDADFARLLLKHNTEWKPTEAPDVRGLPRQRVESNRPVSEPYIELLAREMVLGNWILIPHGIALDKEGNLLDGQQRLKALVLADTIKPGINIPMIISYDWDREVFDRLDQGRNRTLTDLLGMHGEANRFLYSTALRLAYKFDHEPNANGWQYKVTDHELLNYLNKIDKDAAVHGYLPLRDIVPAAQLVAKGSRMVASSAAVGMFVCRRAWPDGPHEEFTEGLKLGYTVTEGGQRLPLAMRDARLAFRNYLDSAGRKRGTGVNAHQLGLYIRTWQLWLMRRQVQIVKLGDTFPVPPEGPLTVANAATVTG